MSAQRTVSIQEAVHMVDNQDLVICSEKFTYLSLRQGAVLTSKKDSKKKKDIVTMYRNRSTKDTISKTHSGRIERMDCSNYHHSKQIMGKAKETREVQHT